MTESTQAEIKRLARELAGLVDKDGKPLFPEVRIPCHECDRFSVTCRVCGGKRYIASPNREDWERAVCLHCPSWTMQWPWTAKEPYHFVAVRKFMHYQGTASDPFLALLRAMEKLSKDLTGEK